MIVTITSTVKIVDETSNVYQVNCNIARFKRLLQKQETVYIFK
jgi:hypothetical protein